MKNVEAKYALCALEKLIDVYLKNKLLLYRNSLIRTTMQQTQTIRMVFVMVACFYSVNKKRISKFR